MGFPTAAESCDAPASGTLQQVAIVGRCGDSPASRPTSFTGVSIPLVMVPQPMDDTTMHIQLSSNSRLSCTSLQHTDSPPTHLIVQMVSSTQALSSCYLGFCGTIVACELKHRLLQLKSEQKRAVSNAQRGYIREKGYFSEKTRDSK
ncbi:hypothetical protein AVEN_230035-1 [Araneus ventricosus]|uniref:Uncharacterized protein n=1 Tax=Araneus ventricosus TaxID=182803 RepID=A0A4Y2CT20_ARAVE|nr:hypothetical protein AVEN_230035-1 [Araneus ventricosus]